MTPIPFSELEFTYITFETEKGDIEGLFSELRLDIETLSEGLIPYEIRCHGKDDSAPATIETHVTVNYFGVIIVNKPLDFGSSDHIEIFDWGFDYGPDDCPEWAQEYLHTWQ